jgi:P-type Ca2+ transporter type 2C
MDWHTLEIGKIYDFLKTNRAGLSTDEADLRLEHYGSNQLAEAEPASPIGIFFRQFIEFMTVILIAAAIISTLLGDFIDATVILAIVFLNAFVGFIQEYRSQKALDALKKMTVSNAAVVRDDKTSVILSTNLVPGDIIVLEAGNIVPADARIFESNGFAVNESALTGEAFAVEKQTGVLTAKDLSVAEYSNMAFRGTYVTRGRCKAIVVETGMQTEVGRIAGLLVQEIVPTPLQKKMSDFSKKIAYIILFVCLIVFIVEYVRGEDIAIVFLTALSLAVAAIPEALPAVLTITLAVAARKMVKQNVLIRKLPAVETLGAVTYICTDKTGTLTQNKMMVQQLAYKDTSVHLINANEQMTKSAELNHLMLVMALNNDVIIDKNEKITGDPTEMALYEFALSNGLNKTTLETIYPRIAEIPFDPERRCMSTIHRYNDKYIVFVKGATETILAKANPDTALPEWQAAMQKMLDDGLRVLGFATKFLHALPNQIIPLAIEEDLVLVGIAGIADPVRSEVQAAVQECVAAGIIPVMITGDNPVTANIIARSLSIAQGLPGQVITGAELNKMSQRELDNMVETTRVYARVSPEQKLNIIEALQKRGQCIAMTGDGVNDAPALMRADIGIAMGISGTDVAKEAAGMILLDDNFATIVKAVKEGRRIYENIQKFICYILTGNLAEVCTIFLAPLLGLPLPLLPIHILWINLVTDSLPGLALAGEPAEQHLMKRVPRKAEERILSGHLAYRVVIYGILLAALTLGTQAYAIQHQLPHWRTMVFAILCFGQLVYALTWRSKNTSLFKQGLQTNRPLAIVVATTLLLQLGIIYLPFLNTIFNTGPLSITELSICLVTPLVILIVSEAEKLVRNLRKG